ncbi:MAG: hypothetical protein J7M15_01200 [Anaerolineae bacterium]|nr:hypothetical protein [Anaerolineae bacterium]
MKALIICDPLFGNAEQAAMAIGAAIGSQPDVDRPRVSGAGPADLAALGME